MPPTRDPFDALTAPRTSPVRRVLSVVEAIPSGKVMSHGDIAALLGMGPREVARVMATQGDRSVAFLRAAMSRDSSTTSWFACRASGVKRGAWMLHLEKLDDRRAQ